MSDQRGTPAAVPLDSGSPEDRRIVDALRDGDETAFADLVEREQSYLLRLARMYVPSRAVAEEVVQETWLGVLRGLDRFEGRASLRTWILRILVNTARTRGEREGRTVPFSSLFDPASDPGGPAVESSRFLGPPERWVGHWGSPPTSWEDMPEERLSSRETLAAIEAAMATLPPAQRTVVTLRDVEGWTSAEACSALGISEANQRVLLHRGRSKIRAELEDYLRPAPA